MLIYIAGAGAMGCRLAYHLTKSQQEVILLDNWEDHISAIQQKGLTVTGEREDRVVLPILRPQEASREADLVILLTKAMQLPQMLTAIQNLIGQKTQVLCLLNGIGHEDVISDYISKEHILMGVTDWTASLKGPGVVELKGNGSMTLQSLSGHHDKGQDISRLLAEAGLNATYSDNVLTSIWRKACVNGTMNALCALLDCSVGDLFASEAGVRSVMTILDEFVSVGQAEGVALDREEIVTYVTALAAKAAHHYPSMHQDLVQNHRLTEIDYINGVVVRKGEKLGLDTPYCRFVTDLIHAKERQLGL